MGAFEALTISSHRLCRWYLTGKSVAMVQNPWNVFAAREELYAALSIHIGDLASRAIAATGRFSIVITGGRSVVPLYERLRYLDTQWSTWRIFWSDERCVPVDNANRNSRQAFDAWLSHVPIASGQIFPIPAEHGPTDAATEYSRLLVKEGSFDLTLLSLGEDGHVASIFPDAMVKDQGSRPVLPVPNAPIPPLHRVSLSLSRLADARKVVLLAVGLDKHGALTAFRAGTPHPAAQLARLIRLDVWADQFAVGDFKKAAACPHF